MAVANETKNNGQKHLEQKDLRTISVMCFSDHNHDTSSHFLPGLSSLTSLFLIWSWCGYFLLTLGAVQRGHSSLTLYQGVTKVELDSKDCPVGVAFNQPELFSCACINGIWAFYENPCASPIAVIGGNHHCFRMPSERISVIVAISNPLRALGDSLTVFEGDMNTIRAKFYRNVRMYMTEASGFVSLNSSWTLFSPDGSRSICLEKQDVMFEGLTSDEAAAFPDLTYCSFVNVSKEMPYIGSVKKGCNSSMVLEAVQCQPMLPRTEEHEVCLDDKLISAYQDEIQKELDPVNALDEPYATVSHSQTRMARALENLGRFTHTKKRQAPAAAEPPPMETTSPKYASTYQGEPEWHQRLLAAEGGGDAGGNETVAPDVSNSEPEVEEPIHKDLAKAWNNSQSFLAPIGSTNDSNQLVTNHLWMYYRYAIRNVLNITRLVPPDEEMAVQVETGKVKKLLNVHIGIMEKICPLAPSSFFEAVTRTFLGLLTKGYRWKEPYVEQTHYLRILSSLTVCKNNADKLSFVHTKPCSSKTKNYIIMPDTNGEGQVNVKLKIPDKFHSGLYEPIIEAVWKIFVSIHSYCFRDFSDQFQDHHKYTTLMIGLFSNQIHDIWMRNKTIDIEYAGVLGNISNTMKELEKCTVGARMKSNYPFHLSRPAKMFRYRDDSDIPEAHSKTEKVDKSKSPKGRKKRSPEQLQSAIPHSRQKRLAINAVNSENVMGTTVFGGRGICLKKYGDSRNTVGRFCKAEKRRNQ